MIPHRDLVRVFVISGTVLGNRPHDRLVESPTSTPNVGRAVRDRAYDLHGDMETDPADVAIRSFENQRPCLLRLTAWLGLLASNRVDRTAYDWPRFVGWRVGAYLVL